MKAMIYKDLVTLKSTYLVMTAIVVSIIAYATSQNFLIVLPLLFIYVPIILNAASFAMEERADFPKFVFTTPISRRSYVLSKYILAILCSILAFISGLMIYQLESDNLGTGLIIGVVLFAIPILMSGIQISFILRYGAEKGRIIMVAFYLLFFIAVNLIKVLLQQSVERIQSLSLANPYIIAGILFVLTLLLLGVFVKAGEKIVKSKEY